MTDAKKPDYDDKHDYYHPKPEYYKVSVSDAYAKEGNKEYFFVSLDKKADHDVKIYYHTYDGTAKQYDDYKPEYGYVVIKAGTKEAYFDVKTVEDHKYEGTEKFYVKIYDNDKYVQVADGTGTGTIYDDDKHYPKPEYYKVSVSDAYAKEGEKEYFHVSLDKKADHDIKIYYHTYDGTAKQYDDYKPEHGYVVIKAGTKDAYFDVKTVEDHKHEGTEKFYVKIYEDNKYVQVADGTGTGTIYDDDKSYHPPPSHDHPWA